MTPGASCPAGRDAWLNVAVKVAPRAPAALLTVLSAALAHPSASSDSLLWLADALDEGAREAAAAGRAFLAAELRALAELPRMLAPHRACPRPNAVAPVPRVVAPVLEAGAPLEWAGQPMDVRDSPFRRMSPGMAVFLAGGPRVAPSDNGEGK